MKDFEVDEIIFQILLSRMNGKKKFTKPIEEKDVLSLLQAAQETLLSEPILLKFDPECAIVGDIHGNIDDLIRIYERLRYPPAMKYVFLGDYVDRGIFGTEVLMLLLALKVKFPQSVYLLRGNHESASLTSFYGFSQEVLSKYSSNVYTACIDVFHQLPLAAIIGERILCLHGGISPEWESIEEFSQLPKPGEIQGPGLFTDIVWSDPDQSIEEFIPNDRGCGYYYGTTALERFLDNNNLDLLVRSHELCLDGISWPYQDKENCLDRCLTIFSNTNYCGRSNDSVVLYVSEDLCVRIEKFVPLSIQEMESKKVLMPVWLFDLISQKETEAAQKGDLSDDVEEEDGDDDDEEEEDIFDSYGPLLKEEGLDELDVNVELNDVEDDLDDGLLPIFSNCLVEA